MREKGNQGISGLFVQNVVVFNGNQPFCLFFGFCEQTNSRMFFSFQTRVVLVNDPVRVKISRRFNVLFYFFNSTRFNINQLSFVFSPIVITRTLAIFKPVKPIVISHNDHSSCTYGHVLDCVMAIAANTQILHHSDGSISRKCDQSKSNS